MNEAESRIDYSDARLKGGGVRMNPYIQKLITAGESCMVEFKTARRALNRDVYETVCAFLNREGGDILFGVDDNGTVQGVDPDCVAQMKQDFVNTINNPQKMNPPCYLGLQEIECDGAVLLHAAVPPSSQVHRCNGRIYDRNEDGDFDITDNHSLVTQLYIRKQSSYSENTIYPYATVADLQEDLIAQCRKTAVLRRGDHPWKNMDDLELLRSARLYNTDRETGENGLTLAGILLLGKQEAVLNVVPHHRTDLILRKVDLDRYDDRDFVTVNLVESYDRIMAFVNKHLSDPFYLEGDMSISIRDAIFREVASNILIHREYMNAFPAKLVIERGLVRAENSSKPHGFGALNPDTFTPFPKNPVIANFFQQIGRADELGSGMRKLMKYGKAFGGADPELVEGDVFKTFITCPDLDDHRPMQIPGQTSRRSEKVTEKTSREVTEKTRAETDTTRGNTRGITANSGLVDAAVKARNVTEKTSGKVTEKTRVEILKNLAKEPMLTTTELARLVGKSESTVARALKELKHTGRLRRIGPDKGGHWDVIQ